MPIEMVLTSVSVRSDALTSRIRVLVPIWGLDGENLRELIPDALPLPGVSREKLVLARRTVKRAIVLGQRTLTNTWSPCVDDGGIGSCTPLQDACESVAQGKYASRGRRAVLARLGVENHRDEREGFLGQHLTRSDAPLQVC